MVKNGRVCGVSLFGVPKRPGLTGVSIWVFQRVKWSGFGCVCESVGRPVESSGFGF